MLTVAISTPLILSIALLFGELEARREQSLIGRTLKLSARGVRLALIGLLVLILLPMLVTVAGWVT